MPLNLYAEYRTMSIVENRQARFKYHIEERLEAGIILEGWEVKAVREKRVSLTEGYVIVKDGRLFLIGSRIDALPMASSHVKPVADRTRTLLLHKKEMERLSGLVSIKGYTIVPLNMHYANGKVKLEIGLAKGKDGRDKRNDVKDREWKIEQSRLMKGQ